MGKNTTHSETAPLRRTYHRHRGDAGACCCCGCCLNLICSCIFSILISIAITVGVLVIILWLVFRPNRLKFHVEDARLTSFNLSGNGTLDYDLLLNATLRNPNTRISRLYDRIDATAFYGSSNFSSIGVPPFRQGHKTSTPLFMEFKGVSAVDFSSGDRKRFDKDSDEGFYALEIRFSIKERLKFFLGIKIAHFKSNIKCRFKAPLISSGSKFNFTRSQCEVDF